MTGHTQQEEVVKEHLVEKEVEELLQKTAGQTVQGELVVILLRSAG